MLLNTKAVRMVERITAGHLQSDSRFLLFLRVLHQLNHLELRASNQLWLHQEGANQVRVL